MAAEFMVAPQGKALFGRWDCYRCEFGKFGITGEQAREEAAAHVRETGHTAAVERGTRELLAGMATQAVASA